MGKHNCCSDFNSRQTIAHFNAKIIEAKHVLEQISLLFIVFIREVTSNVCFFFLFPKYESAAR